MSDESYVPDHRGTEELPPPANVLFSNSIYDVLRILALYVLPAVGSLYFGLSAIWGLPHAQDVVGSIVVIDTFLGALMGVAKQQYDNSDARFDGSINVEPGEEEGHTNLNVSLDPEAIASKDEVIVKINRA